MNRLDPDLLAAVTVLIDHTGRSSTFMPSRDTYTPEDHAKIAAALIRAGAWYAEQHGLELTRVGDFRRG